MRTGGAPARYVVQVRAHGGIAPAEVTVEPDRLLVRLSEPLRGVARGQAVVLYDGDRVVGSATIDHAAKVAVVR